MKVGLSLSRCVRDMVEGKVLFEDVLVIIARTDFNPYVDEEWADIWDGYLYGGLSNPEWRGMEDEEANFRHVCKTLYSNGKLHQPRKFGAPMPSVRWHWLDCVPDKDEMGMNPAVQKAWDNFNVIAGLANVR